MAFEYRNQPWKAVYITANVVLLLFVKLPFYSLLYLLPAARPRWSWSLKKSLLMLGYQTLVKIFWNTSIPQETPVNKLACQRDANEKGFVWVEPIPAGYIVGEVKEIAEKNNVSPAKTAGFWYGKRASDGSPGQKAEIDEKVVYHLHGGGLVMGSAHPSNPNTKALIDGLVDYLPTHPRVFALEYRLASAAPFTPANPFPAALLDALAGYRYLVHYLGFSPSNIIISGDSAGGTVAFWLARYLATNNFADLPNAGGLLLLSPTVDWANTQTGPSSSMRRYAATDCVEIILSSGYTLRGLLGNIPESEAAKNVWVAPGSVEFDHTPGMFAGLPKTCFVVGGVEQTLDGMVVLKKHLVEDLGMENVAWFEAADATHDFLASTSHSQEKLDTFRNLANWAGGQIWSIW